MQRGNGDRSAVVLAVNNFSFPPHSPPDTRTSIFMSAFSLAGYYTLAMILDCELLRRYAETKSEDAFAELERRHINLVYSAAMRQVN